MRWIFTISTSSYPGQDCPVCNQQLAARSLDPLIREFPAAPLQLNAASLATSNQLVAWPSGQIFLRDLATRNLPGLDHRQDFSCHKAGNQLVPLVIRVHTIQQQVVGILVWL